MSCFWAVMCSSAHYSSGEGSSSLERRLPVPLKSRETAFFRMWSDVFREAGWTWYWEKLDFNAEKWGCLNKHRLRMVDASFRSSAEDCSPSAPLSLSWPKQADVPLEHHHEFEPAGEGDVHPKTLMNLSSLRFTWNMSLDFDIIMQRNWFLLHLLSNRCTVGPGTWSKRVKNPFST